MYPSINIPAVTGKIYVIIENLTDLIEELNKNPSSANGALSANGPSSAQACGLEGLAGLVEGNGGGKGEGSRGGGAAAEAGFEKQGLAESIEEGPQGKDSDLFRYLSSNECLELIHLESTRQSLFRAQGFLEDKKQVLIGLARSRQIGK